MHPKHHHQKLSLFIHATILSIYLPSFLCDQHQTKVISYGALKPVNQTSCPGEAFDCGSIGYLAYPFWGGSRPLECGREGFEIVCQAGVPMLNISSLSYRVQEMDYQRNILRVAREDLSNNRCPTVLHNTTIDLHLFKYPPKSNDENVTLYYDCTDHHQSSPQLETLPNKFTCRVNGDETTNLFKTGNASSGPGPHITCNNNIFVPINEGAAQSLENPTASSINILQSALNSGFSIQWLNDSIQYSEPFCNAKIYGSCISKTSSHYNRRPCTYASCGRSSTVSVPIPSAALEERHGRPPAPPIQSPTSSAKAEGPNAQTGKGMPPVQSPGYPPESGSYYRPIGNGMPTVQSPGYPPERDNFRTESNAGKNHAKEIAIVVALSITGVVIASITIGCFLKRRHSASGSNQECYQDVENFLLQHTSLTPKRYEYSEIKKITKSFSDKLGKGGYGSVYKGMLPDGSVVAIKVLIETDSNGEEFINEVASISRTSHVNIVSLLGFCYERKKRALVYEFMPNKSLDKFLNSNGSADDTDCCLDLEKLYKIAVGIAKGLEYLHTGCSTRIVHFDIKPQNILLDEDFCPKISDFGLAKLCKKKQSILSVLGTRGTIGYIAPEVFSRNFGGVSHKSDVYSYGMMVLEMAGARNFFEAEVIQSSENYFPDKIYEQVILDVTRTLDDFMIEEEETRRKMFLIGFWCIQTTPSDRPSMSKVVEMLEGSLQSIQIPPKPFLFTPRLPEQEISSSFSAHVDTKNSAQH